MSMFQSTPPRGGRQTRNQRCQHELAFQSTPPRGGRHQVCVNKDSERAVENTAELRSRRVMGFWG
jgi:hypothetical protein